MYGYIRSCLLLLSAPGRPVVFHYKAPAGTVSIRADSYSINLRSGRISVYRPRIVDPTGGMVAAARFVTLTQLDWRKLGNQRIELTIDHLTGKLVRLSTGLFELENLIPPRSATPTKIPFHVMVRTANVELVDRAGKEWRQDAYTPSVEISGVGSDWIAHARVSLPGMGQAVASVQYVPHEGIHIDGSTPGLRTERALNYFLKTELAKRYSTLNGLSLASASLQGAFRLNVSVGKRPAFSVQAKLAASGVRYGRYDVDHLAFTGLLTSKGAQGTAVARTAGVTGSFTGVGTWTPSEAAAGAVQVNAASVAALPPYVRVLLPKQVAFSQAGYSGYVGYQKGKILQAQGELRTASASYGPYKASAVRAAVNGDLQRLRVDWLSGTVEGVAPFGSADIDLRNKTVLAWARADVPNVESVAQLAKVRGLSGSGNVQAFVSGPLRRPLVDFVATGKVAYSDGHIAKVGPETVDMAGTFEQGTVVLDRALVQGSSGTVAASGKVNPNGTGLAMHIDGRSLTPGKALPGFLGGLDASADVTGTLNDPRFKGHIEGTALTYRGHEIIAAGVDFSGNRHRVTADHVTAISGTMDLQGSAAVDVASRKVDGRFALTGIQATDFLGPNFAGIVDAPDIRVGGSLANPTVLATIEAKELVAEEVVLSSVEALVRGNLSKADLDHATATLAGGFVSASGSYSVKNKSGHITATGTNLDLGRLAPALGERVAITGTTSITEAKATIQGRQILGSARGSLDKVTVNGAAAGDGNWTVNTDGQLVHGTLSVGQILPELRVLNVDASYNLKTEAVAGTLDASHARIQDLLGAASRYLPLSWTADPTTLGGVKGDLTFAGEVTGTAKAPNVSFGTLQADGLSYKNEPLGNLVVDGVSRKGELWTVPGLTLTGPEGTVTAKGTLDEHGLIDITASGKNLKLSALAPVAPSLATNSGIAAFDLKAAGQSQRPIISGDASIDHVVQAPAFLAKAGAGLGDLSIKIPDISLDGSHARVEGTFGFVGFTGEFSGSVPLNYKKGLGTGDAQATLTVDRRSLGDLPLLADVVEAGKSSATVGGSITAKGPLDKLTYSGGIDLDAKTLEFKIPGGNYVKKVDDSLTNVAVSLHLTPQRSIALDAKAGLSRGGSVSMTASAPLIDLASVLQGQTDSLSKQIMDDPLSGTVTADAAKFRQTAPGGYVAAQISGTAALGGTIGQPSIGSREKPGSFTIAGLDTAMPTLPTAGGSGSTPVIDPSFNLEVALSTPARVRSATADLHVTGDGSLRGKLSDPRATANLVVQTGTIVLPGGTVRLDQGGTVNFAYRHPFGELPTATLDVDLGGHTSLTAIRYGRNTERYNISLDIRGDLLKQQALTMQATSDPPDLSSDDVLALLGEKDVFESLGSNTAAQGEAQRRITDALAGFALPAVTTRYTSGLARSLGFDYFSLDYNEFDQTTFSVARTLGSEFSLQYRGQIGAPTPGIRSIQDLRLVYTPRRLFGRFRHLSFSVGADQDDPWKVALEYGIRFGGSNNPNRGKKTVLFAPNRNASPSGSSKLPVGPGG